MSAPDLSVAIIGAGPAGASCASTLLMCGTEKVALVDSLVFPRDKCCGDGIGPGAIGIVNDLGLGEKLGSSMKTTRLSISGPSGVCAQGTVSPIGCTVPRYQFDNFLVQGAKDRGAADYTGHQLRKAFFDGEVWRITLQNTLTREYLEFTSRVLIGADGARSKVRRILGIPFNSDSHIGVAARLYAKSGTPIFKDVQVDYLDELLPAYGWVFPISENTANIGLGVDLASCKNKTVQIKALLNMYKQHLGGDIQYEDGSYSVGLLPLGSELPKLAHPARRAALTGDAGSMVNPLTGEGIYYGMYAGRLVGELLAGGLNTNTPSVIGQVLEAYERQFRDKFEGHYNINWRMQQEINNPLMCDMVINTCRKDHVYLEQLIDLMVGDKRDIGIGFVTRMFVQNFLPFIP